MTGSRAMDVLDARDDLVEYVAREIVMRGLCTPAVLFLEAARPHRPLGGGAMLFFDPVLRTLLTDMTEVHRLMADDDGIERLIDRIEEMDGDLTLDA